MNKNAPTPALPKQFKDLNIIAATPALKLKRGAPGRKLDLRSPDEIKGTWIEDPEDIREAKKEEERRSKDGQT